MCAEHLCRDCGRGWLRFENTCYFLSKNRLTWQESRKECQRKGGDLAVITNERVQVSKSINTVKLKLTEVISILMLFNYISFLQMYLSKKGNLHYWIGLNHLGENEWTWINNTVLTVR